MRITLNGRQHDVAAGISLTSLLQELNLDPLQVAVEINLQLVPRSRHKGHVLSEGDEVEVVTLVGGG